MSRALAAHHGVFGRACIYEMTRPMAMHAHRESHLIFNISGPSGMCAVSGSHLRLSGDTAIAINPWEPHDYTPADTAKPLVMLLLYINPSWFQDKAVLSHTQMHFGSSTIEMTEELRTQVADTVKLLNTDDVTPELDSALHQLASDCFCASRGMCDGSGVVQSEQAAVLDHRIEKCLVLMRERIGEVINLDEIAKSAGLSRPHFYRLFRENLGITPNVYLNTLRMELAIDRLVTTDAPVTSIGLDLGFASQASFTRFFGANVGIPPTDYRRVAHLS